MHDKTCLEKAIDLNDLGKFFVSRANIEGIVALYEPDAVFVINNEGKVATGYSEIRIFYIELFSKKT